MSVIEIYIYKRKDGYYTKAITYVVSGTFI